jgi:uncharacterized repeat protein (TIGR04052 family)
LACIEPIAAEGEGEGEGEGDVAVSLPFSALVNGEAFACQGTPAFAVGSTPTAAKFLDARMYVHGLELIAGNDRRPVTLDEDAFQHDGVGLVDFENGDAASCDTGSTETHTALTGRVSSTADVTGVAFIIGVPEAQNHLDVAAVEPPLNIPGMYWNWTGGYKFLRFDVQTDDLATTSFFHLGSTACTGDPGAITCANPNRIAVELNDVDLASGVAVDLDKLFASIALDDAPADGDPVKGCMSGPADPECTTPFSTVLGLAHGAAAAGAQTLVRAAP